MNVKFEKKSIFVTHTSAPFLLLSYYTYILNLQTDNVGAYLYNSVELRYRLRLIRNSYVGAKPEWPLHLSTHFKTLER